MRNSKVRSILFQGLRGLLAVALLVFLFASGKVDIESLKRLASPQVLVFGPLIVGLVIYFASERWRVLLQNQGLSSTRFHALRLTLIGTFFSFFIPGGVGGDVVKALLIAKNHPDKKGRAILTVLADRILGLFTMTLLALVSFSFEPELLRKEKSFQIIFIGLLLVLFLFVATFWLLLAQRAQGLRLFFEAWIEKSRRLKSLWTLAQGYRFSAREMIRILLLSGGAQFSQILLFLLVANVLGPEIPPISVFLFAVPVGLMVMAVPIAPAGIGVGQAAFYYFFSKAMGVESDLGVIGITAFQAFQLFYGLIGALFFVLLKREDPSISVKKLEASAEQPV